MEIVDYPLVYPLPLGAKLLIWYEKVVEVEKEPSLPELFADTEYPWHTAIFCRGIDEGYFAQGSFRTCREAIDKTRYRWKQITDGTEGPGWCSKWRFWRLIHANDKGYIERTPR